MLMRNIWELKTDKCIIKIILKILISKENKKGIKNEKRY